MQFRIEPKWQPIETAPKDRPIWLRMVFLDFDTGQTRHSIREAYWGVMRGYPQHEPEWLPVGGDDNESIPSDEPFTKNVSIYTDHGQKREIVIYRGRKITHWAEMIKHEVIIIQPDYDKIQPETIRTER
jgi:hypothetical protein